MASGPFRFRGSNSAGKGGFAKPRADLPLQAMLVRGEGALLLAVLCTATLGLALLQADGAQAFADRDCSDFATQAEAQSFFISAGGPQRDPHNLDADGDGRACESLPCPCASSGSPVGGEKKPPQRKILRLKGSVSDVVDGDTIDVSLNSGVTERIRLIGIDTPEVYGGAECGGPEASAEMGRLGLGRRVRMATDPTQDRRDRYGRLLAYVRVVKGPSLQLAMLRAGWARVYVYDHSPFRKVKRFRRAEDAARAANRGAWALCGGPR